jgi:hypothetical protein
VADVAMLFTTHINIAALAQDEQSQASKNGKSQNNFPHTISFKKKALKKGPVNGPGHHSRGVNSSNG